MKEQLILGVQLRDAANFENFYVGDNVELVSALQKIVTAQGYLYFWGRQGVGKSHLLQACFQMASQFVPAFYLSFDEHLAFPPHVLENLDQYSLICLDDIDAIAGNSHWEEALFHLFNRSTQAGSSLLITGSCPPAQLSMNLADLKSRLASGITYHLKELHDDQKLAALKLRANKRGLFLGEEVGRYLLNHYPRDMSKLYACLEELDKASLKAKHRLTIPFVKQVIKNSDS